MLLLRAARASPAMAAVVRCKPTRLTPIAGLSTPTPTPAAAAGRRDEEEEEARREDGGGGGARVAEA